MSSIKMCRRCILDAGVPAISFDEDGICNYCHLQDLMDKLHPMGEEGAAILNELAANIKRKGKNNKSYDCVVGISGGSDSSYLLYLVKQLGLRPLAITVDNGWTSEVAINNVTNITKRLGVDLYTVVLDWEEFQDLQIAFLKAAVPDIEIPTDHAILAILTREAAARGVNYIFNGHSFRTEGKCPELWSYVDWTYIKSVYRKYGKGRAFKTFPKFSLFDQAYYGLVKRISEVRPLYHVDYRKDKIKGILERELGWKDYGTKHHESMYTRFAMGCWLPRKFGIDKRKIHYSAQVRAGHMTREAALQKMAEPTLPEAEAERLIEYVRSKLSLTKKDWEAIYSSENKTFMDYHNSYSLARALRVPMRILYSRVSPMTPQSLLKLKE